MELAGLRGLEDLNVVRTSTAAVVAAGRRRSRRGGVPFPIPTSRHSPPLFLSPAIPAPHLYSHLQPPLLCTLPAIRTTRIPPAPTGLWTPLSTTSFASINFATALANITLPLHARHFQRARSKRYFYTALCAFTIPTAALPTIASLTHYSLRGCRFTAFRSAFSSSGTWRETPCPRHRTGRTLRIRAILRYSPQLDRRLLPYRAMHKGAAFFAFCP